MLCDVIKTVIYTVIYINNIYNNNIYITVYK